MDKLGPAIDSKYSNNPDSEIALGGFEVSNETNCSR
jgi:hypothetical protein